MKLQFIEAGEIVNTHGVRGEMKVLPWGDGPEFLTEFSRVCIGGKTYGVEVCRIQKNCNLLKLEGIETMEDAQAMRGKIVEIFREDVSDDVIFGAELIDVEVFQEGVCLGKITEVLDYPGNQVYVVKGEYQYMIPAVRQFVLDTNLDENRMEVKLIEGMRSDEN